MSKIKAFIAAALISVPMLSLDAAELQLPQNPAPVMSDGSRPTTTNLCMWWGGYWFCVG
jgi:hypothetical protein